MECLHQQRRLHRSQHMRLRRVLQYSMADQSIHLVNRQWQVQEEDWEDQEALEHCEGGVEAVVGGGFDSIDIWAGGYWP